MDNKLEIHSVSLESGKCYLNNKNTIFPKIKIIGKINNIQYEQNYKESLSLKIKL